MSHATASEAAGPEEQKARGLLPSRAGMSTLRSQLFRASFLLVTPAAALALIACGARTGLHVPPPDDALVDAPDVADSSDVLDVLDTTDAQDAFEVAPDAPLEVLIVPDAPGACDDAGATLVYVVSTNNELLSFYPIGAKGSRFRTIGALKCPTAATPFSMAVDRKGMAYVLFSDGSVFLVSTADASCTATPYVANETPPFKTFGMGFAAENDGSESLYVAADVGAATSHLGVLDTASFALREIGAITPFSQGPELTGNGAGQLFGFYVDKGGTTVVSEISKTDASTVGVAPLPGVTLGQGWAFAFWGGDFWLFTAPGGAPRVTRFNPADGSVGAWDTPPSVIVGAGVSTCAPGR